jgi:hypothetical protein
MDITKDIQPMTTFRNHSAKSFGISRRPNAP